MSKGIIALYSIIAIMWEFCLPVLPQIGDVKPMTHSPEIGADRHRLSAPKSGLCVIGFRSVGHVLLLNILCMFHKQNKTWVPAKVRRKK